MVCLKQIQLPCFVFGVNEDFNEQRSTVAACFSWMYEMFVDKRCHGQIGSLTNELLMQMWSLGFHSSHISLIGDSK